MEIINIGQIAIPVKDIEIAITFYKDTLGLEFLFRAPPGLAFFECGEVRLMLETASGLKEKKYSSIVYFRVSDIQNAFNTLSASGVDFVDKPHMIAEMPNHELWMTFFHDPDENLLALMNERRKK